MVIQDEKIQVGVQKNTQEQVSKKDFDQLNKEAPLLADILRTQGYEAYKKAAPEYEAAFVEAQKKETRIQAEKEAREKTERVTEAVEKAAKATTGAPPGVTDKFQVPKTTPAAVTPPAKPPEPKKPEEISLPQKIWRSITPWAESKGETFLSYLANTPSRMIKGDTTPQEELKATYQAETERPWWQTALFGQSVLEWRNNETGEVFYSRIYAAEPPAISPAGGPTKLTRLVIDTATKKLPEIEQAAKGGKALKLLTPEDLGISKTQFERLIQQRIKELGKVAKTDLSKEVEEFIEKALNLSKVKETIKKIFNKDVTKMTNAQLVALGSEIARSNSKEAKDAWQQIEKTINEQPDAKTKKLKEATSAEARYYGIPGRLTYERMQELLKEAAAMKPAEVPAGIMLPLTVVSPATAAKIIEAPGTKEQKDALPKKLREALNKGQYGKAQEQALTEMQTQTMIQNKPSAKPAGQAQAKAQTMARAETKAEAQTKPYTKPETKPATSPQPQTQPQTQTQTETITPTKVKPETSTRAQTAGAAGVSVGSDKTGIGKIPRFTGGMSNKQVRDLIKKSDGAIAWRMGEVGGKDRWDIIVNPYTSNAQYTMLIGKKPVGATILRKGPGSAYGTAQTIKGEGPKQTVKVDSGAFDIDVKPVGKNKVALRFTPDPKQETKGDIQAGTPAISERQAILDQRKALRISGRGVRITPRTPRLR